MTSFSPSSRDLPAEEERMFKNKLRAARLSLLEAQHICRPTHRAYSHLDEMIQELEEEITEK